MVICIFLVNWWTPYLSIYIFSIFFIVSGDRFKYYFIPGLRGSRGFLCLSTMRMLFGIRKSGLRICRKWFLKVRSFCTTSHVCGALSKTGTEVYGSHELWVKHGNVKYSASSWNRRNRQSIWIHWYLITIYIYLSIYLPIQNCLSIYILMYQYQYTNKWINKQINIYIYMTIFGWYDRSHIPLMISLLSLPVAIQTISHQPRHRLATVLS